MSSSYFPSEDPSLSKMMIFHIPKCVSTLTVLFKTAASHFSLLKIPHWLLIWICIGYIIDYMLFFVLLSFIQEAISFLFFCFCLLIVSPTAWFWVTLGPRPLPSPWGYRKAWGLVGQKIWLWISVSPDKFAEKRKFNNMYKYFDTMLMFNKWYFLLLHFFSPTCFIIYIFGLISK